MNIAIGFGFQDCKKCCKRFSSVRTGESSRVWEAFEVLGEQVEFMYLPRICYSLNTQLLASWIYVFAQNLLLLASPLWIHSCAKPQIQSWLLRSSKALLNVSPTVQPICLAGVKYKRNERKIAQYVQGYSEQNSNSSLDRLFFYMNNISPKKTMSILLVLLRFMYNKKFMFLCCDYEYHITGYIVWIY